MCRPVLGLLTGLACLVTSATLLTSARTLTRIDGRGVQMVAIACWALVVTAMAIGRLRRSSCVPASRVFWIAASAGLAWGILATVRLTVDAGTGLAARYYTNTEWSGSPALMVVDREVSLAQMSSRWNGNVPAEFSVLWSGYITVPAAGRYQFTTRSDDASWLFVDDELVVDNSGRHSSTARSGEVALTNGPHRLLLKYAQYAGDADLAMLWAEAGETPRAVPAWALSRHRADAGHALLARLLDSATTVLSLLLLAVSVTAGPPVLVRGLVFITRPLWEWGASGYRSGLAFAFSIAAYAVVLFVPQADVTIFPSIVSTTRELNAAAAASARRFAAFQADLNTPGSGLERAVPEAARNVAALLERHGIDRYRLAPSFSQDHWVWQQVIATAWPRRLEPAGSELFLWVNDAPPQGCAVVDQLKEVTLVRCP